MQILLPSSLTLDLLSIGTKDRACYSHEMTICFHPINIILPKRVTPDVFNILSHVNARIPVATPNNWFAPLNINCVVMQFAQSNFSLRPKPSLVTWRVRNAAVVHDCIFTVSNPCKRSLSGYHLLEVEMFA